MRCCRRIAGSKSAFDDLNAQTTSGSYLAFQTDNAVVSYDEIEVSRFKKYYEAGGVRVAMREAETVSFLLADHLGSTAVTADSNGTRTGELWYKPWGEYRGTAFGATPTSYRFTGQREDATIGLYFYNARYYDPVLGRFTQPDTIVPQPGNPQALNRYAYVRNNPVKFTDPSGHCIVQYSGDVRMNEGPYGTSGLCPHTETPLAEGQYAIEQYHELLVAQEPWSSTFERPIPEIVAGALVPDEGTVSFGGTLTGGAGLMGSFSLALFHIDSEGNVVLLSPSLYLSSEKRVS